MPVFLVRITKKGNIKMGLFSKPKVQYVNSPATQSANEEAKKTEEVAKKQRLLETEGGNKGAQLQNTQGQSVRRIFG